MWTLSRIALFPIKSLDPLFVDQATVLRGGGLKWDRQFALFDADGQVINAKKRASIHQIRSTYDLEQQTVTLSSPHLEMSPESFQLSENQPQLETWFSDFFRQPVSLKENTSTGFPDDLEAAGPTVISTQTYEEVARWFPGISVEELRQRFRANIEFTGDLPFCEDRLYAPVDPPVLFRLGEVTFAGSNPCKRCVVPSRVPSTGQTDPQFMKTFIQKREETFPSWGALSLFRNMYRLSVNTRLHRLPEGQAARIQCGAPLEILS
ncbi:hypothetical protein Pan153_33840 [Gimesia panareensis]|uniref:MOSC domain-containing protein n=1 Tax=Gimesia panareensis TaxID=2527978 RepID=A0A518FQV1_9PLAN|nr:MOSC N-terminal beta barrel domain-containing protein [Gimesia panareensis]QDV18724.1 hypothetical protein Pan153_33840 [Gimesia panareensis]